MGAGGANDMATGRGGLNRVAKGWGRAGQGKGRLDGSSDH